MLLNDKDIRRLCTAHVYTDGKGPMLDPFSEAVSGDGVISYGLSHAGYDLRLGPKILLFRPGAGKIVNPKMFNDPAYREEMFDEFDFSQWLLPDGRIDPDKSDRGERGFVIPANGYILGHSMEYIRMPDHFKGRCVGKSTYARSGILINTTPLEPGWHGHLTIEIGNITPCPAAVFVGEGICQLELELLTGVPEKTYAGKKYQGQTGVTPAKVL